MKGRVVRSGHFYQVGRWYRDSDNPSGHWNRKSGDHVALTHSGAVVPHDWKRAAHFVTRQDAERLIAACPDRAADGFSVTEVAYS